MGTAARQNDDVHVQGLPLEKDMLFEFFRLIRPGKSAICACLEGKRMQMSWWDSKNKTDCGVFLMRHMEMYVGQAVLKWKCGLVKGTLRSCTNLGCTT